MWNSRPLQKILSGSCSTCSGVRADHPSPVLTQIYQSTPPDTLCLSESHAGGETGMCRIKDWASRAALRQRLWEKQMEIH